MALEDLEDQAVRFDKIVAELKTAARHAEIVAIHFRNREVARAGAHSLAMQGHLINANGLFEEGARIHASFSSTAMLDNADDQGPSHGDG